MQQEAREAICPGKNSGRSLVQLLGLLRSIGRRTGTDDRFVHAYAENLSHRLPVIYGVVLFDALILAIGFHGTAPAWLLYSLPLPLLAGTVSRAYHWLPAKVASRSALALRRDLRLLPIRGALISLGFTAWSLSLYTFADQAQQSLIHYVVAVTCFGGILSLGQSPRTAAAMALSVMVPTSLMFLQYDHPNRLEVVAIQLVVTTFLLVVTAAYHSDFRTLVTSRDALTEQKREIEMLADAHHLRSIRDPLTHANNRRRILHLLESALHDRTAPPPWLALVDLDGFKHINDTFGHAAGDAVLIAVCERIRNLSGVEEFGRMGGDEFALILSGDKDYAQIEQILDGLVEALSQPIAVCGLQLSVQASIGANRCNLRNTSECLERADCALYKAKEYRGGRVVHFTEADEISLRERHEMRRVFISSDLSSQLGLVYQPIVDCDSSEPLAYEALARWTPDNVRWLYPTSFISLAETTGRMGELTRLVLSKAFAEFPAWKWNCNLAVNLSARDILLDHAADWIGEAAACAGAPPNRIILEITETALLSDYGRAAENLARLRGAGFRIALDDFGAGQSSLSHVHNLPLDYLKIDQSFARDMLASEKARAVVATIVALARQLHLDCTMKGVETAEQKALARMLGVRMMQGYHFGRPARAEDFATKVRAV